MTTLIDTPQRSGARATARPRSSTQPRTPRRAQAPSGTTPAASRPRRDLFVDAVRALATLSVITVHWLMPEATWDGESLSIGNALGHGQAWIVTWVLQVLPLLFFAAGAAASYRGAFRPVAGPNAKTTGPGTTGPWAWLALPLHCVRRLLPPVGAFVGAWAIAVVLLPILGVPTVAVWRVARIAPQLLWFLGVYVLLLAVTPFLVRAYRAWGARFVMVAVAAPLLVDVLRFAAGLEQIAVVNVLLAWAVPYLLGIAYADAARQGRLLGRRALWIALVAALAATAALVVYGPYPLSMIGMPGDAMSNLGPPTAPVVTIAVAQVVAVLLARGPILRWVQGARGARVVGWVGARSMTLYLWHLTAMFVVVGVVLLGLGSRLPEPWGVDWWTSRPLWFGAYAFVLVGLVRCFARIEQRRVRPAGSTAVHRPAAMLSSAGPARSTAGGAASRPGRASAPAPSVR
jgi:hypothetical protein